MFSQLGVYTFHENFQSCMVMYRYTTDIFWHYNVLTIRTLYRLGSYLQSVIALQILYYYFITHIYSI